MACRLLSLRRCFISSFCVCLAMLFSSLFTLNSKNCSIVLPGCFSSCLCWPCWISCVTFTFAFAISSMMFCTVDGAGTMSPRPTENPRFINQ